MEQSQETPGCVIRSSPESLAHPPTGNPSDRPTRSAPVQPSYSTIACVACMLVASALIGIVLLRLESTTTNSAIQYAVRHTAVATSTLVQSDVVLGEVDLILGQPYNQPMVQTGVPTVYLNLRSGPGTDYSVLTTLVPGTSLTLYEQQDGWYRVSTADGFSGYAAGWYIQTTGVAAATAPTPAVEAAAVPGSMAGTFVSGSIANIRSGPGTEHQLYGTLSYGTPLHPQAQYNGWYLVSTPNGTAGWIAGWLINISPEVAASLPVAEAPHAGDMPTAHPMHAGEHGHTAMPGAADAAQVALRYVGLPYQWGATGPHAFDCSGLIQHVYAQIGVALPRTASQQFSSQHGTIISSMDALQPGDGQVLHAGNTELGVQIDSISSPYWVQHWAGAIRPFRSTR